MWLHSGFHDGCNPFPLLLECPVEFESGIRIAKRNDRIPQGISLPSSPLNQVGRGFQDKRKGIRPEARLRWNSPVLAPTSEASLGMGRIAQRRPDRLSFRRALIFVELSEVKVKHSAGLQAKERLTGLKREPLKSPISFDAPETVIVVPVYQVHRKLKAVEIICIVP